MSARRRLTEQEAHLATLLQDDTGIEMAEFFYKSESTPDKCYRLRPYQVYWWWFKAKKKMNACARDVGKTEHMTFEACAFPYAHPGFDYFLTAPNLDHLRPIVDKIEQRILSIRILRELLINRNGKNGITRVPSFQAAFKNSANVITRIPKDGRGVKGQHALRVRIEEAQDYPDSGWNELFPTLRKDLPGANMSAYGVTAGTANRFDEFATDPDTDWVVFRKIAPERQTWGDEERRAAEKEYKGATSIDYGRNVFGISTGVHSNWYVTARLMASVRVEESPWAITYNKQVYKHIDIDADALSSRRRKAVDEIVIPGPHLSAEYTSYWGGFDVGLTTDPSEILIFGQYALKDGRTGYRLLLRVSMSKISAGDQIDVVKKLCTSYAPRLRRLAMDGTGLGLPIYQILSTITETRGIVRGYGFSEKITVGWEDRKLAPKETLEDIEIKKKVPEHGLDMMREFIDTGVLELPMDVPLLTEWQGIGEDHTLHAGWMAGVAVKQHEIDAKKEASKARAPIKPRIG